MTTNTPRHELNRRVYHARRPGFQIQELELATTQQIPWHRHTNVQDTFYLLSGRVRVFLQDPDEQVVLTPGQTCTVRPGRPHHVTNAGDAPATLLNLQLGDYDFIPLT